MKLGYQTSWQTPVLTLQAFPRGLQGFFMPAEQGDEWKDDDDLACNGFLANPVCLVLLFL
jgi:hypothetical protein